MAHDTVYCRTIFTIFVLLVAAGCNDTIVVYDLSGTSPFGPYCGKDVTLTREVFLVQTTLPGVQHPAGDRPSLDIMMQTEGLVDTFPYAYMVYPNQLDAALEEIRITTRCMLPMSEHNRPVPMPCTRKLPVGTHVHVKYTFLEHDINPFAAKSTWVKTMVRIEGLGEGWPSVITAVFNNGDCSAYDIHGAVRFYNLDGRFDEHLLPAPWERVESPTAPKNVPLGEWYQCKNYVGRVRNSL